MVLSWSRLHKSLILLDERGPPLLVFWTRQVVHTNYPWFLVKSCRTSPFPYWERAPLFDNSTPTNPLGFVPSDIVFRPSFTLFLVRAHVANIVMKFCLDDDTSACARFFVPHSAAAA